MRYSHYLNQRVFFVPIVTESDKKKESQLDTKVIIEEEVKVSSEGTPDQNAHFFEEQKAVQKDSDSDNDEVENEAPKCKRVVLSLQEVKRSQVRLRSYPPVLLHTLFHEDPRYDNYRSQELSNLFFFGDEIKSLGNEAYHRGDYYEALDYYE